MSGAAPAREFDLLGDLPTGTTVLEASAGTGKTFTIAALATRYVAEGVAELPRLLLVTFSRAATGELRERVRARLVGTERALRGPSPRTHPDALVRHLAAVDDDELARRRDRLTLALSQVDAATITTTHGFCQQALRGLGTAAGGAAAEPGAALLPDVAPLVQEVVDDLYLAAYVHHDAPVLTVADARAVARAATSDRGADLEPVDAPAGSPADHRRRLGLAARARTTARKRATGVVDYDDLVELLRDALTDPVTGGLAAQRVRAGFDVVMVDEFQDTDEVQWQVLRTAFHRHRTLVLIGDPKQAVYAFRGADVHTYLAARADATSATLPDSWRADAPLLDGLAHVLGGAALGDPRIVVHPVRAARPGRRLVGGPPVTLRRVTRGAVGVAGSSAPKVDPVRALVHRDVAAQVVRALEGDRVADGDGWRPLRPGDVAVLVRRNADALATRDVLVAAGVPAVVSVLSSVFATPAARDWLVLLTALTRPDDAGRAGAASLTAFVGWDAQDLALADDAARAGLADRMRRWSHVLAEQGVAALLEAAAGAGLHARLLARVDGERAVTDVRHVGEVLHAEARERGLGPAALTEWLRARIEESGADYAEERSRRLETDAAAVQVVTVHAAKGLEFPVVMVPFLWDRYVPRSPSVLRLHDPSGSRVLHVGGPGSPGYDEARERHLAEEAGEDLRLAYVALTRASSRVVVWWGPSTVSASGAVGRLVLGGRDADGAPSASVPVPRDDQAAAAFDALAGGSGGTVVHEVVTTAPGPVRWSAPQPVDGTLEVARLGRAVGTSWRRTSYSGLTARAHDAGGAGVVDEPEVTGVLDEQDRAPGDVPGGPEEARLRAVPSPAADLPGGTAFGTLVHDVLEHVDTGAADLPAELLVRCVRAARPGGPDPAALAAALLPALRTPCGPLLGGRSLAQVPTADRLAELEVELPLAGGRAEDRRPARLADVADLLRTHLDPADPFAGYADRLAALDAGPRPTLLRGYLTGSVDAVLRVPAGDGHRYVVVDYKTNRLAGPDEALTAWHYRPAALVRAMVDAHYPLQLLLYTVALHRFLRWRLPGYDPEVHLGGGTYLFVRGMCGPGTPVVDGSPCGVVPWRPPTPLVTDLSALLHGARP